MRPSAATWVSHHATVGRPNAAAWPDRHAEGCSEVDDDLAVHVPTGYRDQVARLTDGARELLARLAPPEALRRWMDLFGEWIATKNGMLDTLVTMIESGEIAHAETQAELLAAIGELLEAGRVTGELRADVTAEDIAAGLIGIFTVARPPKHRARASRLLDILMDGLRS